jgi:2-polyprenyl-3-methyl-5-hydroxy-6-metoxy-1,4-benzoquinol methylase
MISEKNAHTSERAHELTETVLARYMFASRYTKNKTVLDIGTGFGVGAEYLLNKGAETVHGIDFAAHVIKLAKNKQKKGLTFSTLDALHLSKLKSTYDVIVASEVIEHMPHGKYTMLLEQIKNQLTSNSGIAIITTVNKHFSSPNSSKPLNPYHTIEFTPEEFMKTIRAVFKKSSFFGMHIRNNHYMKKANKLKSSFFYQIILKIGSFQSVRELVAYLPQNLKSRLIGESTLPKLTNEDFIITKDSLDTSIDMIAVCRL